MAVSGCPVSASLSVGWPAPNKRRPWAGSGRSSGLHTVVVPPSRIFQTPSSLGHNARPPCLRHPTMDLIQASPLRAWLDKEGIMARSWFPFSLNPLPAVCPLPMFRIFVRNLCPPLRPEQTRCS